MEGCLTCKFFHEAGTYGDICRRFPPTLVPSPTDNQHPVLYTPALCWPYVSKDDWCGEYRLTPSNQQARHD